MHVVGSDSLDVLQESVAVGVGYWTEVRDEGCPAILDRRHLLQRLQCGCQLVTFLLCAIQTWALLFYESEGIKIFIYMYVV